MSNFIYLHALGDFLDGSISMSTNTIRAALVVTGGTHYVATNTDNHYDAIASTNVLATSSALGGISTTFGTFTAANISFVAVTSATNSASAIVLFQDTGTASTSPLVCYIDSYSGLPVTPTGQTINITWPAFIFKI